MAHKNKLFALVLIAGLINTMEPETVHRYTTNPRELYERDKHQTITDSESLYDLAFDHTDIENEHNQQRLESINQLLWPHHLQITAQRDQHYMRYIINLRQPSHTDSGSEELIPLHRVSMPLGNNQIEPLMKKKILEKRLDAIKELALHFRESRIELIREARTQHFETISFNDKMAYKWRTKIWPKIISTICSEISESLSRILICTTGLYVLERFEFPEEAEVQKKEAAIMKKLPSKVLLINNLTAMATKIAQLRKANSNTSETQALKEQFINNYEQTLKHLVQTKEVS